MKKTFCSAAPWVLSALGPLLAALWSADKDNVDDKQNISRTKEIPCFIVERKPLSTQESTVSGVAHISLPACRRGRVRLGVQGE